MPIKKNITQDTQEIIKSAEEILLDQVQQRYGRQKDIMRQNYYLEYCLHKTALYKLWYDDESYYKEADSMYVKPIHSPKSFWMNILYISCVVLWLVMLTLFLPFTKEYISMKSWSSSLLQSNQTERTVDDVTWWHAAAWSLGSPNLTPSFDTSVAVAGPVASQSQTSSINYAWFSKLRYYLVYGILWQLTPDTEFHGSAYDVLQNDSVLQSLLQIIKRSTLLLLLWLVFLWRDQVLIMLIKIVQKILGFFAIHIQFPQLWIRYDISERKILSYILPALRIGYIAQRKEYVMWNGTEWEHDPELIKLKSQKMKEIISEFDDILKNDQRVFQKDKLVSRLLRFFSLETALLFWLLFLRGYDIIVLDATTLNIIVWATVTQVVTMLIIIVKNLYPLHEKDDDTQPSSSIWLLQTFDEPTLLKNKNTEQNHTTSFENTSSSQVIPTI